jgi:hypothetical protein
MSGLESKVFKDKKFSDILEEIYNNQKKKEKTISNLISELKDLINDIGDATLIVPLIANYLEIGVKNDEHLLKMATVVQRIITNNGGSGSSNDLNISDDERDELLKIAQEIKELQTPPEK